MNTIRSAIFSQDADGTFGMRYLNEEDKSTVELLPFVSAVGSLLFSVEDFSVMVDRVCRLLRCNHDILLKVRDNQYLMENRCIDAYKVRGLLHDEQDYVAAYMYKSRHMWSVELATSDFYLNIVVCHQDLVDYIDNQFTHNSHEQADLSLNAMNELMEFFFDYTNIKDYIDG